MATWQEWVFGLMILALTAGILIFNERRDKRDK